MRSLFTRRTLVATVALTIVYVALLYLESRPWWCKYGLGLWTAAWTRCTSQHFLDPYALTHVLHGVLFYWLLRPVSADTAIRTVFSTPPFPSYPSGHSTMSAAVGEVFAELFPDAAAFYRTKALEASESRVLAGVHYRFDIVAGDGLGLHVGTAVVARARTDGAGP